MKDVKVALARTIIEQFAETYRNRKATLNSAEKSLYEAALILSMKEILPRGQKKAALEKFGTELIERRAAAAHARATRSGLVNVLTEAPK